MASTSAKFIVDIIAISSSVKLLCNSDDVISHADDYCCPENVEGNQDFLHKPLISGKVLRVLAFYELIQRRSKFNFKLSLTICFYFQFTPFMIMNRHLDGTAVQHRGVAVDILNYIERLH